MDLRSEVRPEAFVKDELRVRFDELSPSFLIADALLHFLRAYTSAVLHEFDGVGMQRRHSFLRPRASGVEQYCVQIEITRLQLYDPPLLRLELCLDV
jgi:hypothetical protein